MSAYRALAPAKINLGLFLGPRRPHDRRHELVTVMQSISLADEVWLEPASPGCAEDVLDCPGVAGAPQQNLAWAALRDFRAATGWGQASLRVRIVKRIPVAAGLGGGSADAAAVLRLAQRASGLGDQPLLRKLAAGLGADVPAQLAPGRWLATGAGECLQALADPEPALALLLIPLGRELSTAAVYAKADRLGLARSPRELQDRRAALHAALALGQAAPQPAELLTNDLQAAALSLCPEIGAALAQARRAGAQAAFVSGSGPTVVALFAGEASDPGGLLSAERARAQLDARVPAAICARSVDRGFARVERAGEPGAHAVAVADMLVRHNHARETE